MASKRQRSARSRPGAQVELQFVNVVPNSKGRDQKLETRSIVRTNAAYFHWRQNRPPRKKDKAEASRRGEGAGDSGSGSREQNGGGEPVSRRSVGEDEKGDAVYYRREIQSMLIMPLFNADLGYEVDPFSPYDSKFPRGFVSRCVAFNARIMLPSVFPEASGQFSIKNYLLELSLTNPCVLHMFIMGALIHSQGPLGSMSPEIYVNVCTARAEIIRRLSIILTDSTEACKDINIFTVASLTKYVPFERVATPLKTPKQGPLRDMQALNSIGLTEIDMIHFDGLTKVVRIKGGIDNIVMPGLAHLISFSALRVATRYLTVPRYPIVMQSSSAKEFIFQDMEVGFTSDPELYRVLSLLKSYTMMIDDFCEARSAMPTSVLIDHRNMAQHALLSLPRQAGSLECHRLAAIIYSLLVVFPIPYIAAPFAPLVRDLKTALGSWDEGNQLLPWVLAMGCIGATGLNERKWFVDFFGATTREMGVGSWSAAKELIKLGLWFDATNDGDGMEMWLESQSVE